MKIINKIALILSLTVAMGANSAFAQEAGNPAVGETVVLLEKALVEVNKSDFSAAQIQLKAARNIAEKLTGNNEAVLKEAYANIIEGQKGAKVGDVKKSADGLNKSIALYKSL